jgi:hypothetical protein
MELLVKQVVLKTYDLNPDGIRIVIKWDAVVVGSSFFVPCVNTHKAVQQINKIVKNRGWQVHTKTRIEDNKLGVRMWRTV